MTEIAKPHIEIHGGTQSRGPQRNQLRGKGVRSPKLSSRRASHPKTSLDSDETLVELKWLTEWHGTCDLARKDGVRAA
jgi:hypothetical protein